MVRIRDRSALDRGRRARGVSDARRALGLDCGTMGGFDAAKTDAKLFPDSRGRSTLLLNLGYGDPTKLYPRNPRLDFEEPCRIV